MGDNKNLIFTYVLSLIGGLFGLHHLYLARTQHALLWVTTLGGGGIGFLYEFFFLIPAYVREANKHPRLVKEYQLKMIRTKSPAWEIFRLCGQYLTAVFYGFIVHYAFSETWHQKPVVSLLISCCSTIAVALGTQITGTLGPRRCSFMWPLLGAILGMPMIVCRTNSSPSFNIPAILSSLVFEWKIEWNPAYFSDLSVTKSTGSQHSVSSKRKRRHFIQRCFIFGLGAVLFSGICASALYQNLHVDLKGRHVRVKDIFTRLFESQELASLAQQFLNIPRQLWALYWQYGFKGIWMIIDSENEIQAYNTLNLTSTASQSEIESQCRALPRQWHPDRYRNSDEKQKAQVIFLSIQQACDRLSNERKRRQILNTQGSENPN